MTNHGVARRVAGAVLVLGAAGAGVLAAVGVCRTPVADLVAAVHGLGGGTGAGDLERLLTGGAAVALQLCSLWVLLVTAAGVVEAFTAVRAPRPRGVRTLLGPVVLRRLVALACGTALGSAAVVGPVAADPGEHPLRGLPLPDRTHATAADGSSTRHAARPAPAAHVVVRPGDSLWRLAERGLAPGADTQDVDRRWRALYRANRAVLGPDPDLIHPGDVLDVTALTHDRKEPR